MDESEFDFEFDFLPEHSAATAEEDEELLWEESIHDQPRRRTEAAAPPPPNVVMRRRVAAGAAVALLLLVILIVVLTSGGGGSSSGSYRSYVDDVSPVASDSQQAGASLGTLTAKNATGKLDALILQTVEDINRLQAITPPSALASQHAQALTALNLRLLGLQELRNSLTASGASPEAGVAALVASDRIWDGSARTPANAVLQARGLGGVFPSSTFVGDQAALLKTLRKVSGSPAASATGAVLSLGSKGQDVVAWQNALNQWVQATGSSLSPLTADGTFGASTQALTQALQTNQGLSPDGVVGPSTRQALQKAVQAAKSGTSGTSTAATLKLGDTGQDVVAWQTQLNRWLKATAPTQTPLSTDGNFGAATQTATEQLQTAAGLTPTGQVDAQTRQALTSALANASPSRG